MTHFSNCAQTRWHLSFALICLLAAYNLQNPHLLPVRSWVALGLPLIALLSLTTVFRSVPKQRWVIVGITLIWLAVIGFTIFGASAEYRHRRAIIQASDRDPDRMSRLGEHLVMGYENPDEIRELVQRGLIGGVFITHRNIVGKSFGQIRAELALLQDVRRQAKLPPLLIATDQEGGSVSRLSPPLPLQPTLASTLNDEPTPQEIEHRARQYGTAQARALVSLGINTNFSPVVDLKPLHATSFLDFHTQIADRAIASDPDKVAEVALAYSQALFAQGVMPTLKHFPGLGSVTSDTHHFSAHLNNSLQDLNMHDWQPFQRVLRQTPALLMVGHVTVTALDETRPASVSPRVLTGLIRRQWQFNGIMISDDLSMAPIYNRGLCRSSVESLNAGMDLLLVSYDWKKYYTVLDCLRLAAQSGELRQLEQSHARLQALPWHQQNFPPLEPRPRQDSQRKNI